MSVHSISQKCVCCRGSSRTPLGEFTHSAPLSQTPSLIKGKGGERKVGEGKEAEEEYGEGREGMERKKPKLKVWLRRWMERKGKEAGDREEGKEGLCPSSQNPLKYALFRYALPSLLNKLPALFREPRSSADHHHTTNHSLSRSSIQDIPIPQMLLTIDPLTATVLLTGLQPDCLHGFRTAQWLCFILCKLAFSQFLTTRK